MNIRPTLPSAIPPGTPTDTPRSPARWSGTCRIPGRDTLYVASHIGRIRGKIEAETKALSTL
jgi:hypothetical protein